MDELVDNVRHMSKARLKNFLGDRNVELPSRDHMKSFYLDLALVTIKTNASSPSLLAPKTTPSPATTTPFPTSAQSPVHKPSPHAPSNPRASAPRSSSPLKGTTAAESPVGSRIAIVEKAHVTPHADVGASPASRPTPTSVPRAYPSPTPQSGPIRTRAQSLAAPSATSPSSLFGTRETGEYGDVNEATKRETRSTRGETEAGSEGGSYPPVVESGSGDPAKGKRAREEDLAFERDNPTITVRSAKSLRRTRPAFDSPSDLDPMATRPLRFSSPTSPVGPANTPANTPRSAPLFGSALGQSVTAVSSPGWPPVSHAGGSGPSLFSEPSTWEPPTSTPTHMTSSPTFPAFRIKVEASDSPVDTAISWMREAKAASALNPMPQGAASSIPALRARMALNPNLYSSPDLYISPERAPDFDRYEQARIPISPLPRVQTTSPVIRTLPFHPSPLSSQPLFASPSLSPAPAPEPASQPAPSPKFYDSVSEPEPEPRTPPSRNLPSRNPGRRILSALKRVTFLIFYLLSAILLAGGVAWTTAQVTHLITVTVTGYLNRPYCDSLLEDSTCASDPVPPNGSVTAVRCRPCPPNGVCSGGELQCLQGFQLARGACVKDSELHRQVARLRQPVTDFVCRMRARHVCGWGGVEWVGEGEIRSEIIRQGYTPQNVLGLSPGLASETGVSVSVEDGWEGSSMIGRYSHIIEEALSSTAPAVGMRVGEGGGREYRCADGEVGRHMDWGCRLGRWGEAHLGSVVGFLALVLVGALLGSARWQRRRRVEEAERVYGQVCEELEEVARTPTASCRWVVASHLRDTLLHPRGGKRGNRGVWAEVESLVNLDSRIAVSQKVVKGEPRIVWEWQADELSPSPAFRARLHDCSRLSAPLQGGSATSTIDVRK